MPGLHERTGAHDPGWRGAALPVPNLHGNHRNWNLTPADTGIRGFDTVGEHVTSPTSRPKRVKTHQKRPRGPMSTSWRGVRPVRRNVVRQAHSCTPARRLYDIESGHFRPLSAASIPVRRPPRHLRWKAGHPPERGHHGLLARGRDHHGGPGGAPGRTTTTDASLFDVGPAVHPTDGRPHSPTGPQPSTWAGGTLCLLCISASLRCERAPPVARWAGGTHGCAWGSDVFSLGLRFASARVRRLCRAVLHPRLRLARSSLAA